MSETNYKALSVCIITRDQSDKLGKCLEAVSLHLPGADIAVLDTGSRDDSYSVAAGFTDNIGSIEWCDDFSAAKNECIKQAVNDTVLVLDTDEYIEGFVPGEGVTAVLQGIKKYPEAVGRIKRRNSYINEQGLRVTYDEWINRLFDRRFFHYEGRIHEQVVRKTKAGENEKPDYRMFRTDILVLHDGYDLSPSGMIKKAERNADLLLKENRVLFIRIIP